MEEGWRWFWWVERGRRLVEEAVGMHLVLFVRWVWVLVVRKVLDLGQVVLRAGLLGKLVVGRQRLQWLRRHQRWLLLL